MHLIHHRRSALPQLSAFGLLASVLVLGAAGAGPAHASEACTPSRQGRVISHGSSFVLSSLMSTSGERVDGSGRVVERDRAIGPFNALRVNGPLTVRLHAGATEALKLRAEDNIEPLIESRIEGTMLTLGLRRGASFRARAPIEISVTYKDLVAVAVAGSSEVIGQDTNLPKLSLAVAGNGDILLDRVEIGELRGSISGSGDICLTGRADQQQFSIAGSGDVRADRLQGRTVRVRIAGSGDARVAASEELVVSIAGSGDVTYRGEPKLTKSVAGSGSVVRVRP